MIRSPMGPGFFIFFHRDRSTTGGGDEGRKRSQIPTAALRWRTVSRIRRSLAYHRKQEVDEVITPHVIEVVTEAVVNATSLYPIQKAYGVDSAEADRRIREFVKDYIRQIQDDEITLLIIMSEI